MQPRAALYRGEVPPASYLPAIAREWHVLIVENNLEPTRLTYSIANHFLPDSAGKLLPGVVKELRN